MLLEGPARYHDQAWTNCNDGNQKAAKVAARLILYQSFCNQSSKKTLMQIYFVSSRLMGAFRWGKKN